MSMMLKRESTESQGWIKDSSKENLILKTVGGTILKTKLFWDKEEKILENHG